MPFHINLLCLSAKLNWIKYTDTHVPQRTFWPVFIGKMGNFIRARFHFFYKKSKTRTPKWL